MYFTLIFCLFLSRTQKRFREASGVGLKPPIILAKIYPIIFGENLPAPLNFQLKLTHMLQFAAKINPHISIFGKKDQGTSIIGKKYMRASKFLAKMSEGSMLGGGLSHPPPCVRLWGFIYAALQWWS